MKRSQLIGAVVAVVMLAFLYIFTVSGAGYILKQSGDLSSPYISIVKFLGLFITFTYLIFIFIKKRR